MMIHILNSQKIRRSSGFTLVELMVAMTITLLLMAGLAKSFGVIGQSIQSGRSQVTLSGKIRNLSFSLRDNLRNRTVNARPPISSAAGNGYFMFYEGPLTEHTFGLFGACPERVAVDGTTVFPFDPRDTTNSTNVDSRFFAGDSGPTYRRFGRVGDFDDYIAFTAEASGGDWFTGKVPAYLVDDTAADPMEPRVIRSKYAEIIIWASPRWNVDPTDNELKLADNPSAMPLYQDENRDLVPDNIVLHKRVLLIRPDLNAKLTIPGGNPFDTDVLRPLGAGTTDPTQVPVPLQRVYPVNNAPPAGLFPMFGVPTNNQLMLRQDWLVGMAPMHHFFDLSLRRIIHPDTGDSTGFVAANSLGDLTQPQNRFGHVRYPGSFFGLGNNATSMPLLALGWNDAILNWQGTADLRAESATATAPAWFPVSQSSPRTSTPTGAGPTNGCGIFNGWLLPHFELGDPSDGTTNLSDSRGLWQRGYLATPDPRWDRTGEDVIATNILEFDLRGYDPTAPVFVTSGADGQPGRIGVDDDGAGTSDVSEMVGAEVTTELGMYGTDDELMNVTDIGIYNLMGYAILDPTNPATFGIDLQAIANRGAFVDLLYPYLAGTPLRNRLVDVAAAVAPVDTNYNSFMTSELSLYPIPTSELNSMKQSGKLVHSTTAGDIVFFQPTYDTWTDAYEHDGFDQAPSTSGEVDPVNKFGTIWILNNLAGSIKTPRLQDTNVVQQPLQVDSARLVPDEPETSPPLAIDLPAVSLSVRVLDPATEEMTQFTLIEDLQK